VQARVVQSHVLTEARTQTARARRSCPSPAGF
jgi:hypothetical protein